MGNFYSGTKQASKDLLEGPSNNHTNYGPNGPIGVGALFIPVGDFFNATVFYLYTSINIVSSVAGDTLFLPVDLIYMNNFSIEQTLKQRDIKSLVQHYKNSKITEPPLIAAIVKTQHDTLNTLLQRDPKSVNTLGPLGYSPLFYAALLGDTWSIDRILSAGGELTPSYAAITLLYLGDASSFTYLFDRIKIDPSQSAPKGIFHSSNLLTAALRAKHPALAKQFIELNGVDLNYKESDGTTPLLLAINSSDINITATLLEHGASAHNDLLTKAALHQENLAFFDMLLQHGALPPPNAILLAVDRNDLNLTKRLIKMGVNINATYEYSSQNTALHLAALRNNPDMIRLLVVSGIDVNIRNSRGTTPLYEAIESKNPEAVRTLLDLGADPEIPFMSASAGPIKPLEKALKPLPDYEKDPEASRKRRAIIAMLIPQSAITYGTLIQAVHAGDVDTISFLIDYGIDPNAGIAIYYAKDSDVLNLLVDHGADGADRKRFVECVTQWKQMFANTYYSGTPEENCEYHCQKRTEGRCP